MPAALAGADGAPEDGRRDETPQEAASARVLRYGLAGLWAIDAGLQLQPAMFTRAFPATVLYANATMYQPGWLSPALIRAVGVVTPHLAALDVGAAALQLLLAMGLCRRPTLRIALAASIVWALLVWVVGEGLGAMATGTALAEGGAPGPALLYVAIALAAWPGRTPAMASAGTGVRAARRARLAWTAYWLMAAGLHLPWRYPPGAVLAYTLQTAALAEPGALAGLDYRLAQIGDAHGVAIAAGLGLAELLIALAVWAPRLGSAAPLVGATLAAAFWVVGEAMGGVFSGVSPDLGAAPAVLLLAGALCAAPRWGRAPTLAGQGG